MPSPEVRRISIADFMILIPAIAAATLILRAYMPGLSAQLVRTARIHPDPWYLFRLWDWAEGAGSCIVIPLMAALIAMRLRQPRPRWKHLVNQPGFVACLVVLVSMLPGLIWIATIHHRPGFQRARGFEQAWTISTYWTTTAVLGGWIALAMSHRWRPERSWIDRTGRALGFFWLFVLLAAYSLSLLARIQTFFP